MAARVVMARMVRGSNLRDYLEVAIRVGVMLGEKVTLILLMAVKGLLLSHSRVHVKQ